MGLCMCCAMGARARVLEHSICIHECGHVGAVHNQWGREELSEVSSCGPLSVVGAVEEVERNTNMQERMDLCWRERRGVQGAARL